MGGGDSLASQKLSFRLGAGAEDTKKPLYTVCGKGGSSLLAKKQYRLHPFPVICLSKKRTQFFLLFFVLPGRLGVVGRDLPEGVPGLSALIEFE